MKLAVLISLMSIAHGLASPALAADLLVSSRFSSNVLQYDAAGNFVRVFASGGGLNNAIGMDFGADGHLYVASGQAAKVFRYDGVSGAFLDVFVQDDPATARTDETGGLQSPRGISFGPDGHLYVSSGGGDEVLVYRASDGQFLRSATNGGLLNGPIGLCFDSEGDLYVAGGLTGKVHRYNPQNGTFLGIFAEIPNLLNATGVTFGPNGNLYVASGNNSAVYEYDGTTGEFLRTVAMGDGLSIAIGLQFDDAGNLLVASFDSDSVFRYAPDGTPLGEFVAPGAGGLDGSHFLQFLPTPVETPTSSFGSFRSRF